MLFNFFDYGKNRTNGTAWDAFYRNLKCIFPFPDWVYQEWNERADWWPRFHNIPLDYNDDKRTEVFKILNRSNKKRKL